MVFQNIIKYNKQKVFYKGFIGRILRQGKCYYCLTIAELRTPQDFPAETDVPISSGYHTGGKDEMND